MTRVAVVGLGAMGSRVARRLAAAGDEVVGSARSGRAPEGVRAAATPAEAARAADVVLVFVTDDVASRAVWTGPDGILAGLRDDAVALEQSTVTPAWAAALAAQVGEARFLDAPVVGTRPHAESGALVHLVGGAAAALARARPVLERTGSAIHHLGATPAGAHAKLLVNASFTAQVALAGELLGLGRAVGLDPARLVALLASLPVTSPASKAALEAMLADRHDPLFPVDLAAKDLDYAARTAADVGLRLPITEATRERFRAAAAAGLGGENLTAVAKVAGAPRGG